MIEELLGKLKCVLECKNDAQAQRIIEQFVFYEEEKRNELKESLFELVSLKNRKEEFGKDEYYLKNQPLAWEKAERLIDYTLEQVLLDLESPKFSVLLKTEYWEKTCHDGCCHTYGTKVFINEKQVTSGYSNEIDTILEEVLKYLKYEVHLDFNDSNKAER